MKSLLQNSSRIIFILADDVDISDKPKLIQSISQTSDGFDEGDADNTFHGCETFVGGGR